VDSVTESGTGGGGKTTRGQIRTRPERGMRI